MAEVDFGSLGFAPADAAPPPAAARAPGSQARGPKAFPDGGGELPDGSATRDPAVWARWVNAYKPPSSVGGFDLEQHGFAPAQEGDPVPGGMPTAAAKSVPASSRVANLAAGGNEALAGMAGLPVDLLTAGINLGTRGINAVAGTNIPSITDPVGGSGTFKRAMGVVGANPQDVVAQDTADHVLRATGAGIASAAVPAGGAALAARAGLVSEPAAATALDALGRFTAPNVAISTGASVAGDQAAQFVPDDYKPIANLAGGLAGGGAVAGGIGGWNSMMRYVSTNNNSKPNDLLDAAGMSMRGSTGAPVRATPGQFQAAGRRIEELSSDPQAVRSALSDGEGQLLEGSPATTFQVTRDPGLGQVERGLSRDGGPGSVAFGQVADAQNDARVGAIRSIAPDADVSAVPRAAQTEAVRLEAERQATVGTVRGLADRALDQTGGNYPPGSDAQVGAAVRAPAAARDAAARQRERELWDAIDPDGTLAVDMSPVRERAREIMRGQGPNAAPLTGEEAAIMETAANLPGVQGFRDLKDLRERITTTLRGARIAPERAQEVMRLSRLLDGVHGAMAKVANEVELPPAPSTAPAARTAAAPNVGSEVFTPSGQRVGVRYELVDAGDLVTSHGADITPNPAYPQQLQPRQRDRAASEVQVANIASRLQPERLGASSTVADGAPIIGPDGIVESGNGRVLALRRAYMADGPQAQAYRDWLTSQGHDVSGMQQPVLVRRRTTEMTPEERVAFAGEGSTPTTLAMSATERAGTDVRRLSGDVLQQLKPGDITDPANRDFVRAYLRNVVEPGQEGAFVTADGSLSQEGASRVRAALVHRAYGDQGLSAALAETTDPTARVLAGAMQDAAGPMAHLRSGIEAGAIDPKVDLAPALVEATQLIQQARRRGISLADAVAQQDAFSRVSPQAEGLLRAAYGEQLSGRMSQERMTALLTAYAADAHQQGTTARLFGDNLSPQQLLEGVTARYGKDASAQAANGTTGAVAARPSDGQGGGGGGRPVAGAGREAPSGGGGGQQGGRDDFRVIEPPEAALTPNFDQAAADRYAAARQATAARKGGYDGAPGVRSMLQGGQQSGTFRLPDAGVPSAVFRPGAAGADHVRVYLDKGGTPDAVSDAAAFSLRQAAMRDGVLDPAKYESWARRYAGALSGIPEARGRFETAALAQRAVEVVEARYAASVRDFQASSAGQFLGAADPVSQVGRMLRSNSGLADMRSLAALTANNPDARAGLQRAIADFILRDLKGDQATVTGSETRLRAAELQKVIRKAGPALREVMTDHQVRTLTAVVDDLQQSALSSTGTRVGTGSDTVQNAGARTLGRSLLQEAKGTALAGPGALVAGVGGYAYAGPLGAVLGGLLGTGPIVARAMSAARAAGLETVDDLVREAMVSPAIAQALLARVTPASRDNVAKALASALARASVLPPVGSDGKRQAPMGLAARVNTLLPLVPAGTRASVQNQLLH